MSEGASVGLILMTFCLPSDDLLVMLAEFKLRPAVIQTAMHTLCKISNALSAKKHSQVCVCVCSFTPVCVCVCVCV